MLAIDGVGFDWSDMAEEQVQTNMALMAFSDSELNQTEFTAATYKRGLATVEEQLITYRKNEVLFSEEVAVLKREVACKDYEINVLKSEFEKVKQEKEGIKFKIKKFDKASKDLDQLPKKLDLSYSGLDEFKEPEFKRYGPENSKQESNIVCDKKSNDSKENSDNSLVKEQVSKDTSSFVGSSLNVDKEIVFPVDKNVYAKPKIVETARPNSAVVNAVRVNQENAVKASPQQDDTGFVDSGCSRHMTGNIAYLSDFKEFDGGYVTFGGGAHSGRISGKGILKTDSLDFEDIGEEAVHKELGDRMKRAATTASSLEAEQDSGSGPKCQDTILGDVDAQTRFETTSKQSNDPPLSRGYTLGSGEDRMKLLELMELFNAAQLQLNAAKLKHQLVLPVQVLAAEEIIDFLKASSVHYTLTVNPTIYTSCIEQFRATAKIKTVNDVRQIQALIDKKKLIITETSIRSDLHLEDAGGTDCLPTATIFEELARMDTAMASLVICLATSRKFNLSKYIFDDMVKHLDGGVKFLLYSRFLQVFINQQLRDMSHHKKIFVNPSHTKKFFANMKREGKDFSRRITPLFDTMMVQASEEVGEDSDHPTDSNQIPIVYQPSTSSQPKKKQKYRRKQRKEAEVSQDETEHEESIPTPSNDPLPSGEDSMQLNDLMVLCTKLQKQVLDLEKAKSDQAIKIACLKKRVEKLEMRRKFRTTRLQRLKKIGTTRRIESSNDSLGAQEDASKQGRRIEYLDANDEVTLINETQERQDEDLMFDARVLDGDEMFVDVTTSEKEEQKEEEANIALIESWENTQAMMEADRLLAESLQTREREGLTDEEKGKLFMEFMEKRRKHFVALRAQEKRNRPPIKAQKRSQMSTYLKHMGGYKHNQLKGKSYKEIQKLFDKEMKRVNTFVAMSSEHKKSMKRRHKVRQRMEDDKKTDKHVEVEVDDADELKKYLVIVKDDDIAIVVIPLATKPPVIVEYKLLKEEIMVYYQLIRADGSSKRHSSMTRMLQGIDREDLQTLWKLVKTKHSDSRLEDEHERVLWGDLKVMFEPDIKSDVWRNLQGYKVTIWKLYDSCGVHFVSAAGYKDTTAGRFMLTEIRSKTYQRRDKD
ncbi:hypothetical protein Tco_1090747 [Tanacetum coccineum]|uniref:Retrovirus-related Pol polyprotein from transposon TNT 1-94-like beta-barrel domain-containing protein n=1 Tax=Tanacetum coccineum TaxID=301880 RepID=A0ABQ5I579_9ASTR